jgi:RHS repeat-associated protein
VPVYDLDGNMTNYNGWTYTYNGENRLIVAENSAIGVRVEADYDYMGRRLFKKVYNNNALTKHSVYVYDGFKQIAEFDALNNNSLKASYLWQPVGLDVVLLRNNEYLVADGNKNIIQVRNATGSVTDSYVYDPFGKVTHNGSSETPFQFSSEFFDDETELVYYNYRYYNPNLGRWINRDPIEEEGGWNLYCFIQNCIINIVDHVGLVDIKYRAVTADEMDEFYKGNDNVVRGQIRKRFGIEVWPEPATCRCCKANDGKVVLAQKLLYRIYIWKFIPTWYKEWKYDGEVEMQVEKLPSGKRIQRVPAYTDTINGKTGTKGSKAGSYVDSPTIEQTLLVEAWCRCPDKDYLLTKRTIKYRHDGNF